MVKPVHQIQTEAGDLIVDDKISDKTYTNENEIVCCRYNHSKGIIVKGHNLVRLLYHARDE